MKATSFRDLPKVLLGVLATLALVFGVASYAVVSAPEAEAQTTLLSSTVTSANGYKYDQTVNIQMSQAGTVNSISIAYPYASYYPNVSNYSVTIDGVSVPVSSGKVDSSGNVVLTLTSGQKVTNTSKIVAVFQLWNSSYWLQDTTQTAKTATAKVYGSSAPTTTTTTTTPPSVTTTSPVSTTPTTTSTAVPNPPQSVTYQTINSYIDVSTYPAYLAYNYLYADVLSQGKGEINYITIDFPNYLDFNLNRVVLSVGGYSYDSAIESWTRDPVTGLITIKFKPGFNTYYGQRLAFGFGFSKYFNSGYAQYMASNFSDNSTIYLTTPVYVPSAKFKLEKVAGTTLPVTIETNKPATLTYDIKVTNVGDLAGQLPAGVMDALQLPSGMTVNSATFTLNGTKVTPVLNGTNYEISPSIWGSFAINETKTIRVTVTATPDSPLTVDVATNPKNYSCSDVTKKDGFWNKVSLVGETDTSVTSATNNAACIRPFSNASTGPTPVPVPDTISYLADPVQNPPLQQRCGQNVAIVFDVSNSIGTTGLQSVKEAGTSIVNALAGTTANIGIFNFATNAPANTSATQATPLSMQSTSNVNTLLTKINSMTIGTPGGTNWEGALLQVANSGTHYDAVYLVTDGVPTTNQAQTTTDLGGWTHTADLNDAIVAANSMKLSGTHIESITVGLDPNLNEYLLKNDVYRSSANGSAAGWKLSRKYVYDPYNYGGPLAPRIADGTVYIYEDYLSNGYWYTRNITNTTSLWSDGRRTSTQMIQHVVGPNQTDSNYSITSVSDFAAMKDKLRNLIVGPCVAKLNITKTIVNPDGSFKKPGDNWSFDAQALPSNIVLEYDASGTPKVTAPNQTKQTDAFGKTEFWIGSQTNQLVSVNELIPANSPYRLYPQTDLQKNTNQNAVCSMKKLNSTTGQIDTIPVKVTNKGATGFDLTMLYETELGAVRSVDCEVKNVEEIAEVEKTPLEGTPVVVNPDGTGNLVYTIKVSNPAIGPITTEPIKEIFRLPSSVAINGDVKLEFPATTGSTVTGAVTTIPKADVAPNKEVQIASSVALANGASQEIKVTVPIKVVDMSTADWGLLGRCDGDGSLVSQSGVPNSVSMVKDQYMNNNNACIPITPPPPPAIKISKVAYDPKGNQTVEVPLDGAEFALYYPDAAGNPDMTRPPALTLAAGTTSKTPLQPGYYWLVETKSPVGYQLLAQPVKLQVTGDATGWVATVADGSGLVYLDTSAGRPANEIWIKVADISTAQLPRTGGTGLTIPIGIASVLIAAGFLFTRRKPAAVSI